jgi:hypothetical protein
MPRRSAASHEEVDALRQAFTIGGGVSYPGKERVGRSFPGGGGVWLPAYSGGAAYNRVMPLLLPAIPTDAPADTPSAITAAPLPASDEGERPHGDPAKVLVAKLLHGPVTNQTVGPDGCQLGGVIPLERIDYTYRDEY